MPAKGDNAAQQTPEGSQSKPIRIGPTLASYPPPDRWDDWTEYDAKSWPKKVERRYSLVPTTCFNCEAACGLLAYVDQESGEIQKLEGNPLHPGSRGRNCAKGPAIQNTRLREIGLRGTDSRQLRTTSSTSSNSLF